MVDLFGNQSIDIPCPACGKAISKRIADIKRKPKFPCPVSGCNGAIDATDFVSGLKKAEDALDDFGRSIGDIDIKL